MVKGDRVYVPLTVDRKVMVSVMKTHAFSHITYEFVPGAEVIPYLAPHEARRLFGGAGAASHAHPPRRRRRRPPSPGRTPALTGRSGSMADLLVLLQFGDSALPGRRLFRSPTAWSRRSSRAW